MTQAQVGEARQTLEARGEPVNARAGNRLLRRTPPRFMGGSFRDLRPCLRIPPVPNLRPCLRIPPVPSGTEQALRELTQVAESCEAAVRDGTTCASRQKLITDSEDLWRQGMAVMRLASAGGEDVTALATALDRLGKACGALIVAHARR